MVVEGSGPMLMGRNWLQVKLSSKAGPGTGVKKVGESEDSEFEADDVWLVEEVGGIHKLYQGTCVC